MAKLVAATDGLDDAMGAWCEGSIIYRLRHGSLMPMMRSIELLSTGISRTGGINAQNDADAATLYSAYIYMRIQASGII